MQRITRFLSNILVIAILGVIVFQLGKFVVGDHMQLLTIESPLVFSSLVGVALFALIVLNLIEELRPAPAADGPIGDVQAESSGAAWRQLGIVLLFALANVLYVILLRYIHFIADTFIFLVVGMIILNEVTKKLGMRILWAGVASLITVPVMYIVFDIIFDVVLP